MLHNIKVLQSPLHCILSWKEKAMHSELYCPSNVVVFQPGRAQLPPHDWFLVLSSLMQSYHGQVTFSKGSMNLFQLAFCRCSLHITQKANSIIYRCRYNSWNSTSGFSIFVNHKALTEVNLMDISTLVKPNFTQFGKDEKHTYVEIA